MSAAPFLPADSVLSALSLAIQCILLTSLLIRFRSSDSGMNASLKYTVLYYVFLSVYFVTAVILGSTNGNASVWLLVCLVITSLFAVFASWWCAYLLLFYRLKFAFQDTLYETKRTQINLHYANLCVLFAASVLYVIVIVIIRLRSGDPRPFFAVFVCAFSMCLGSGYAHLLYAFNHNLFSLVLSQRQTIIAPASTSLGQIELNDRQKKLLMTVRKHSILGVLLVASNVVTVISLLMQLMDVPHVIGIGLVLEYMAYNVMSVCIYLAFSFNKDAYGCLCRVCDRRCKTLCIRVVQRRIYQTVCQYPATDQPQPEEHAVRSQK